MAGKKQVPPGPTMVRRQLGRQLKQLREAAGLTADVAAAQLEWSRSKLWRIENGRVPVRALDVEAMCRRYDAPAAVADVLMDMARASKDKGWWHPYGEAVPEWFEVYVGMEGASKRLRMYESELVPGLLQTPDYAAEVFRAFRADHTPDEVERRVKVRMERQAVLDRTPPPQLHVVLNEAVLRRPVGSSDVMAEQLQQLADLNERRHVAVEILPFAAGAHPGMMGPFVILDFPSKDDPSVVYLDTPTGAMYLEESHELARYGAMFDDLAKLATPLAEARDLLA